MKYRPAPATHFAEMRDSTCVVLDLEHRNYLHLNPSGAILWRALQGGASLEKLAQALVDAFDIEPESARRDTSAWLEDMIGRGAVVDDG